MKTIAGKYDIVKELGEGVSGKVYLVQHHDLKVEYALKVLNKSLDEEKFIERFKREAGTLLRFSHPGTVQLRDFGRTETGHYYMAMDYCAGVSLKKLLEENDYFGVNEALDILDQLLSVVGAAHELGIIHRDIKPENIMMVADAQGRQTLKILDFGIAKLKETIYSSSSVTLEGVSIGTPQYMSPEQASGEFDLDHRVDIYSTGVVMYELLTGKVPFEGITVVQTLLMHLTRPPLPIPPQFKVPTFVQEMVMRALEKNRDFRYQNIAEFQSACRAAIARIKDESLPKETPGKTSKKSVEQNDTSAPKPSDTAKTKILCLDDNEMILNILSHILEKAGFEVFTATNCAAIHSYLFSDNIKLLISDVNMPDLLGTKVCKMLKKHMNDLKVILFSNVSDRELERLCVDAQADGWISKNTRPDEWLLRINEILDNQSKGQ